jgi:mono/diheme cytochrome c family protein
MRRVIGSVSGFGGVTAALVLSFSAFGVLAGGTGQEAAAAAGAKPVDFAKDVKPIFAQSCVKCHGAPDPRDPRKKAGGGLRLDDKAEALKGGKSGKAVVPGNAKESLLYKLLQGPAKAGDHEIDAMPKAMRGKPFKPLAPAQVEVVKKWIDQGAK